jgi:hypothetical protein
MKKIFYLVMAVALVFSCGKEEDEVEKQGSIYGVITDKATGEPINAASVELTGYWGDLLKRTITGSEGQYEFLDLDEDDYWVKVSTDGYEKQSDLLSVQLGEAVKCDIQLVKINTYMTVRTLDITDIGGNSATLNGIYDDNNYSSPNEYGFLYATQSNPSNGGTKVSASLNTATSNSYDFIKTITDLSVTTYYVQAYAKNSRGTEYGEVISFIISGLPTVSTLAPTNVTANAVTLNGKIEFQGDPAYTEKGFVYSNTFQNPTIEDDASATIKKIVSGTGTEFSANVTELTTNTTYYVRAYVTSSKGTVYGESISFKPTDIVDYVVLESDGIMVQKNDISSGATWSNANSLCQNSTVGGYSDWRLPTIGELQVLYAKRVTIGGFNTDYYTSSTSSGGGDYFYLNFNTGTQKDGYYLSNTGRVRAVRTLP